MRTSEFTAAKVRLIRFLHQEMGFGVLAFESSLFECHRANQGSDHLTAEELMRSCISPVWYSNEILPLFQYILETRNTARPLRLAGFDTQTSTKTAEHRPAFWRALLEPLDDRYAQQVATMDSSLLDIQYQREALAEEAENLIAGYRRLEEYLEDRGQELINSGADEDTVGLAQRMADSIVRQIQQLTSPTGAERTRVRDEGMSANLNWLMNYLYSDEKIVTWGHNFHLRHANQEVKPNPVKTMGAWMAEGYRDEMYTIGLYMRSGRAALNNRQVYNVAAPSSGSLESILGHVGEPYFFVDLRRTGTESAGEWVRKPIVTKTWGRADA